MTEVIPETEVVEFTAEDRRKLNEIHAAITEIAASLGQVIPNLASHPLFRMLGGRKN